jgi:hypothetical protein
MEALILHAEVKALQNRLGISYKDAAHRLYLIEVEKMKIEKLLDDSFAYVRQSIDNTIVNEICTPISQIDDGNFH